MSFILDALKKSETDRQRQTGPSLFEVKIAPPRRALPVWAVAIAVLLGINIVVISWMLLRHPAAQQPPTASNVPAAVPAPAPTPARAASAGSVGAQAVGDGQTSGAADTASASRSAGEPAHPLEAAEGNPASSLDPSRPTTSARTTAPTLPAATGHSGAPDGPSAAAALASNGDNTAPPPAGGDPSDYAPAVQPADSAASAADAAGDLPLYQQIVSSAGLPALHLDLHVFAARPQDRFVMINMHRLGEGSSLPSGVRVEAIRPDGVVLTYRSTRFLLPRN
ncbi:MAG: general secretion pathway protein GspB [Steroidobacterales bacterium]